jgi:hypothetical protein
VSQHKEFPELTPEARRAFSAAFYAAEEAGQAFVPDDRPRLDLGSRWFRRCLAAFLREALGQAGVSSAITLSDGSIIDKLFAIANNLYSAPPPPPPPPTLAQARAADLDTPEGRDVVRDFLATLGEGG